jgi:hypothetical protein
VMMFRMIAAGEVGEKRVAVPAEFGLEADFGFVVGSNGHVFGEREELAQGRGGVEAERSEERDLLFLGEGDETGVVVVEREGVEIREGGTKAGSDGWFGNDGLGLYQGWGRAAICSGVASCLRKLGNHSRKRESSRPSRTAQRTCNNR